MEYIVYLTINTKNKKIYIGVHGTEEDVFDGYLGNGVYATRPYTYKKSKTLFQRAVNKYGPDSFKRITLKVFEKEQDAYDLEEILVDSEFISRDDTYNMVTGGNGGDRGVMAKPIYQYDIRGYFINEYKSGYEAARQTGICSGTIKCSRNGQWPTNGFFWLDYKIDKINFNEYKISTNEKPVYQYSRLGEYEHKYDSVTKAGLANNSTSSLISRAIKAGYTVNDKYFSYDKENNYSRAKSEYIRNLIVHQYSLEGNYIKSFNSKADAIRELGIKNLNIGCAIKLGHSIGGFQWSYEKVDKMKDLSKNIHYRARKVGQYDKNCVLIKIYDSVSKCRKEFCGCD